MSKSKGMTQPVFLSSDMREWIDFACSVSHRGRAEEILACVRECKRQSESLQFKVKTADLVDALRVMVMAYNSDYQRWLRETDSDGVRADDMVFPLMRGPINSVSQAVALLERLDGNVDKNAS